MQDRKNVWLLSALTVMVVVSAYMLLAEPAPETPVAFNAEDEPAKTDAPTGSVTTTEAGQDAASGKGAGAKGQQTDPTANAPTALPTAGSDDFFANYRYMREEMRARQHEELLGVLASSEASAEAVAEAKKKLDALEDAASAEMQLEELIKAEGYPDAVVMQQNGRVNVVVKAAELKPDQVLAIIHLVSNHLNISGRNVTVSFKP